MQRFQNLILSLFMLGIIVSCSGDEATQQALMLTVSTDNGNYQISDYRVLDRTFKKSNQQGDFQVHLLDQEGKTLGEITFQKLQASPAAKNSNDLNFLLPLLENLHQVAIYQLDGSSGHYQVPDNPLVIWILPDSAKTSSH